MTSSNADTSQARSWPSMTGGDEVDAVACDTGQDSTFAAGALTPVIVLLVPSQNVSMGVQTFARRAA
jgi:hypothetical protein